MENIDILNATLLEPRVKHQTIFARFDELKSGESFILLNDHDPKPLYYQLISQKGEIFTWDYQGAGPDWWKIKITLK
jgi:regulator of cell morphogenesis and NO signaling